MGSGGCALIGLRLLFTVAFSFEFGGIICRVWYLIWVLFMVGVWVMWVAEVGEFSGWDLVFCGSWVVSLDGLMVCGSFSMILGIL